MRLFRMGAIAVCAIVSLLLITMGGSSDDGSLDDATAASESAAHLASNESTDGAPAPSAATDAPTDTTPPIDRTPEEVGRTTGLPLNEESVADAAEAGLLDDLINNGDHGDGFWADRTRDDDPFVVDVSTLAVDPEDRDDIGEWSSVMSWPHIPVSAANLPDGTILTWASNQVDGFPGGQPEFTHAAVWDPVSGSFTTRNINNHDAFCAALVVLEEGIIFTAGGRNTVDLTSSFDWRNGSWSVESSMSGDRWYPTAVALPTGEVLIAAGQGNGETVEIWTEGQGWRTMTGLDLTGAPTDQNYHGLAENWPILTVAPNGTVFHAGAAPGMYTYDLQGSGTLTFLGNRPGGDWYPRDAAFVMYDEGEFLVTGGRSNNTTTASTNLAMTVDLNGASPVATMTNSMQLARGHHNLVMLPTGEVLALGGNTSGIRFSDEGTQLTAEVWNPDTGVWRTLSDSSVPRNYHSIALLLTDGRVLSAGGGLGGSGHVANHQDAQIYTPAYLYNPDGTLAPRPSITSAPTSVHNGETFSISTSEAIDSFSMVKMGATTHQVNTDQRFLELDATSTGTNQYSMTAHPNQNVLTPGYYMIFAVNSDGVPSEAAVVQVSTNGTPELDHIGEQSIFAGPDVDLDFVNATDPNGDTITYSAEGLPSGLSLDPATGALTGNTLFGLDDTYVVTVYATDGVGTTAAVFNLNVRSEGVAYSYYEGDWDVLPNFDSLVPVKSGVADGFSIAEREQGDNIGFVFEGCLNVTDPGDYTFLTNSDDGSRLWLNDALLVDNDGLHAPVEVESAIVNLAAGLHVIEVHFFEKTGGEVLDVSWNGPTFGQEIIPASVLVPCDLGAGRPVIDPIGDQTSTAGVAISLAVSATDPDGDLMNYAATGLPPGLSINATSGVISGTVTADNAGTYAVTVTVDDGTWSSTESFGWTIDDGTSAWLDFTDETASRLSVGGDSFEKDVASGDLDRDGWVDVVVVRKNSFATPGGQSDILLMNLNGTLTDQTSTYAPGFTTNLTDARDVLVEDLDGDGWLDVVVATTFEDQPVFYRNAGMDAAGNWLGLVDESSRLPADYDTNTVQFCAIVSGDVNGDGHTDLYFANYAEEGGATDILLINDGTGNFVEESAARLGTLRNSAFGTSAQIIDMDNDGDNDIVKLSAEYEVPPWNADGIFVLFNDGTGNFSNFDVIPSNEPYMFAIGDIDGNGLLDMYVQDDEQDYVQMGTSVSANSSVSFNQVDMTSARTASHSGNLRLADLDGDGDLDLGLADVDTMFPPCVVDATDPRKFAMFRNDGGVFVDPFGGAAMPWSLNTFDFEFIDIDRDGRLDVFAAQCNGYAVYSQSGFTVEAESGSLSSDFLVGADAAASGGEYIYVAGTGGLLSDLSGALAEYTFSVPTAGTYRIVGEVYAASGSDNSFWVQVDGAPAGGWLWDTVQTTSYDADYVNDRDGADPVEVFLSAGVHTVQVYEREDGTRLDTIALEPVSTTSNTAPSLTNPGAQTATVGDSVSLAMSASDPDGDPLSFAVTGLPPGLSLDTTTGVISGDVTADGVFTVVVNVNDEPGDGTFVSFTWTVDPVPNTPPVVDPIADQASTDGDAVSLTATGSDADGDTISWSAGNLPGGLAIDSVTGEISGTIDAGASSGSPYDVTVTADDGTDSTDATFEWTVNAVPNTPPVVDPVGDQASSEGDVVSLTVTGSDADGDTISWSATGLPDGLAIDSVSGEISGTVATGAAASSPFAVTVTADDGTDSTDATFDWTVVEPFVNTPPTIDPILDQTSTDGDTVSVTVSGSDADGDPISWSATGLPDGLGIDSVSGEISGTIASDASSGSPYAVTVTASDGTDSTDAEFDWTVGPITSPSGPNVSAGLVSGVSDVFQTVSLPAGYSQPVVVATPVYTGSDAPVVVRVRNVSSSSFEVAVESPSGGAVSGYAVEWIAAESGVYSVADHGVTMEVGTVTSGVTDASGSWVAESFGPANSYVSPVVLGQVMSDNDVWSVFWARGAGLAELPSAGDIRFGKHVAGDTSTVRADETVGYIVVEAGSWVVDGVSFEAGVTSKSLVGVVQGTHVHSLSAAAQHVVLSTAGMAGGDGAWPVLTAPGVGVDISMAVDEDQVGDSERNHIPEFAAYLAVNMGGNIAPMVDPVSDQFSIEGDVISLTVSGSDPDGDPISWSASDLPTGLSMNGSTGEISGTIAAGAAALSPFSVTVTADDGTDTTDEMFSWSVSATAPSGPNVSAGLVSGVSDVFQTVSLPAGYSQPVVVATPVYTGSDAPVVVRVRNVSSSSFEVAVESPSGGAVSGYAVEWIAAESGVYSVADHGVTMEVGTVTSGVTDASGSWVAESFGPANSYVSPVVLGQVMSDNDVWSVFWARGAGLAELPSAGDIRFGKHVAGDTSTVRADETVGYIVVEAGSWVVDGVSFEAGVTSKSLVGVVQGTHVHSLSAAAQHVVLSTAGMAGGDGAWPVLTAPGVGVDISMAVDEDQVGDSERNHIPEFAAYLAVNMGGNIAPMVDPVSDQFSIEGDVISLTVSGSDPDGDPISWSASDLPTGLSMNGSTGEISGTIAAGAAALSPFSVTVTADDGTDTTDEMFSWSVSATAPSGPNVSAGLVSGVSDVFQTVSLPAGYSQPVVVATPVYTGSDAPVVVRVRNVSSSSFEVAVESPSGGAVSGYAVEWIAAESGVYSVADHGVTMEVGTVTSGVTDASGSWVAESFGPANSYVSPVVLGQVMSDNDVWSVFWARGAGLAELPSAGDIRFGKHVAGDTSTVRADETVGYIVVEAGSWVVDGVSFEAGVTSKSLVGVVQGTHVHSLSAAAQHVVLSTAGMAGGDGAWPVLTAPGVGVDISMAVDEDQVGDSERNHIPEFAAYFAVHE